MYKTDVSIIIVNYNTYKMTSECIDSIFDKTKGISFEVILIDNSSTDGSNLYFKNEPRVNYVYLTENIGFGRANNVGIEKAKGKYLFLLNSDTLLIDNVVKELFDFAENHTELNIGALGTCLVNTLKQDTLSFGRFPSPCAIYSRIFQKSRLCKTYEHSIYEKLLTYGYANVDHISGANLFMPSLVIKNIGGFDPAFFMYYEETDLEKRMAIDGYKRIIIDSRKIIHFEGGSFSSKKRQQIDRTFLIAKSMLLYINKHFHGIAKIHISLLMFIITLKDVMKLDCNFRKKTNILRIFWNKHD